jgi:hypothetical protein
VGVLYRNDGTPFIAQAYRELLVSSKRSLLFHEIRVLVEQHGQYLHLYKKNIDQLEVAFSQEPGYLLGESIWYYFGKPQHLIYCEALESDSQVLLVIIREGAVYLDIKLPHHQLKDELLLLLTDPKSYRVVTHNIDPFIFPKQLVGSFGHMSEALFPRLPLLPNLRLQSLNLAIKSAGLQRKTLPWFIIIFASILFAVSGYWLFANKQALPLPPLHKKVIDTYAIYHQALSAPTPLQQFLALGRLIQTTSTLPGWAVQNIYFDGKNYRIQVISLGGNLAWLETWVKNSRFSLSIQPGAVYLTYSPHLANRKPSNTIYAVDDVMLSLLDQINFLLRDKSAHFDRMVQKGPVRVAVISVQLDNLSLEMLDLIGARMQGWPVVINLEDLQLNGSLISGRLQLSVWGV